MRTLKTSAALTASALFALFGLSACNSAESPAEGNAKSPVAAEEDTVSVEEPAGRQVPAECSKLGLELGAK